MEIERKHETSRLSFSSSKMSKFYLEFEMEDVQKPFIGFLSCNEREPLVFCFCNGEPLLFVADPLIISQDK